MLTVVRGKTTDPWCHFPTSMRPESTTWPTRAHARCACCRCCRPTGTGRVRSWRTGWGCRCGRCAATSTGCASWAIRSRRNPAWTADTSSPPGGDAATRPRRRGGGRARGRPAGRGHGAVAGVAETSVRALAKVVPVMPPRLRRRVEALRMATVPATSRRRAGRRPGRCSPPSRRPAATRSGWSSATPPPTGTLTSRLVEPFRLVPLGRRWYLVAYDLYRHDWRSFRLDRLDAPRRTGARFRPRDLPPTTRRRSSGQACATSRPPTRWRCWSTRLSTPFAPGSVGG